MKTLSDSTLRGLTKPALIKTIKELYAMREEAIDYIRDCCNMDSKWVNLHFDYAQNEMSSDQVDDLLDILQGNKEE